MSLTNHTKFLKIYVCGSVYFGMFSDVDEFVSNADVLQVREAEVAATSVRSGGGNGPSSRETIRSLLLRWQISRNWLA